MLIAEYIRLHQQIWPEIKSSIYDAGGMDMQIYRSGNQLFMIMDTHDQFTLEGKAAMDAANPKVIQWETLMGRLQQVDESGDPTRRWQLLEKIFSWSKAETQYVLRERGPFTALSHKRSGHTRVLRACPPAVG